MNKGSKIAGKATVLIVVLIIQLGCSSQVLHKAKAYHPAQDPLTEVQQALQRAASKEKLALVVLGANWCHDSRAVADRIDQSPLKELIGQHYELLFVDVGYYEQGRAVMGHFGEAMYYATPTVLVIDPETNVIVNNDNRQQWGAAATISMEQSMGYFQTYAGKSSAPPELTLQQRLQLVEIGRFERTQAERVAQGYALLGPQLRVLDQTGVSPEGFDRSWRELARFRNTLATDLQRLRNQIKSDSKSLPTQVLPVYPALSWER